MKTKKLLYRNIQNLAAVAFCSTLSLSIAEASDKLIIGGDEVSADEAIAHSVVFLTNSEGTCTGTIVDDHWVQTAAHCVFAMEEYFNENPKPKPINVVFKRQLRLDSGPIIRSAEVYVPEQYTEMVRNYFAEVRVFENELVHGGVKESERPAFRGVFSGYDVALVRLPNGIPEGSGYLPASMLDVPMDHLAPGTTLFAAGYGVTALGGEGPGSDVLRAVSYQVDQRPSPNPNSFQMDQRYGKGACYGDSGGPIYRLNSLGRVELVGSVSGGANGCGNYLTAQHLGTHMEWLMTTMQSPRVVAAEH